MFDPRKIPSILNISGQLDRTLFVFRHRYYPYMMICLVTFGLPFLVLSFLFVTGKIQMDMGANLLDELGADLVVREYVNGLIVGIVMLGVPSLVADLALQYYTSYLVRGKEITWTKAIRLTFSKKLLAYIPLKVLGYVIMVVFAVLSGFLLFIPLVGVFSWVFAVMTLYSLFVGMAPAILVEEKRGVFGTIGRNLYLGQQEVSILSVGSTLGVVMIGVFIFSCMVLFYLLGMLLITLSVGTPNLFEWGVEEMKTINYILTFFTPVVNILVVIPLQSIFYAVLYYNMRSRKEGFHLENLLNAYGDKVREDLQEREEIKATA